MIVVCAWCVPQRVVCEQDGREPLTGVTHTICPKCVKLEFDDTVLDLKGEDNEEGGKGGMADKDGNY